MRILDLTSLYRAVGLDLSSVGLSRRVAVLHYGIFVTALGYLLWFGGLSKAPASTAGVFTGVWPVSAGVLSYAVLGEQFAWAHLVGVAGVLVAILLIARDRPPVPFEETEYCKGGAL